MLTLNISWIEIDFATKAVGKNDFWRRKEIKSKFNEFRMTWKQKDSFVESESLWFSLSFGMFVRFTFIN